MADSALVRTARALDLIPYIVEHSGITIEALAHKFNTSELEISETLNTLFMCGLPGYTHLELIDLTTEDGVVSVLDPQNLSQPRKLSQQEIVSLILGLENLRTYSNTTTQSLINSVRQKLSNLVDNMEVLTQVGVTSTTVAAESLSALQKAIADRRTLKIVYHAIAEDLISTRSISPLRIYGRTGIVYLEAINEEGLLRNYRVDCIQGLGPSDLPFIEKPTATDAIELNVEILIPRKAVKFFESIDNLIESSEVLGEARRILLKVSHTQWILRALSAIPGEVQILQPESLRLEFAEFNRKALKNYL